MMVRIPPVASIDPGLLRTAQAAAGGSIRQEATVYRTLANHPDLMAAWLSWGGHVTRRSSLPAERRELVVLRSTLLAQGRYPTVQHVRIAADLGLDPGSIARTAENPSTADWDQPTRVALVAVDQIHHHGRLDDRCWADLDDSSGLVGAFDLLATVAFYRMACWMLNACRTPLDDGQGEVDLGPPVRYLDIDQDVPRAVRVDPLPLERWEQDLLDDTVTWPRFHGRPELRRARVYGSLAHHPALFRAIGPLMAHLLVGNALTAQQREIVIVRSCLHDRGAYAYRQHVRIAAETGVTASVLDQLAIERPTIDAPAASAIAAAVDELHHDNDIGPGTWDLLAEHLQPRAIMDLIATAGFYGLISFVLNAANTPLEAGDVHLPPKPFENGPR